MWLLIKLICPNITCAIIIEAQISVILLYRLRVVAMNTQDHNRYYNTVAEQEYQ